MRFAVLLAILFSFFAGTAQAQSDSFGQGKNSDAWKSTKLEVGKKVPGKLTVTDIDGKSKSFKDLRGKVVVVSFWSDSCPYFKAAEPKLQQIYADYTAKGKQVEMVAIAANQREIGDKDAGYARIRKHLAKNKVAFPIYLDHGNKITDMFGARTTPHCYVVAADGVLAYDGALDDDPRDAKGANAKQYVREAVDALLSSRKVETPSTKPYG